MNSPEKGLADSDAFPSHMDATCGMTYREWLAGMAMQGYLASGVRSPELSAWIVKAADALITELAKPRD